MTDPPTVHRSYLAVGAGAALGSLLRFVCGATIVGWLGLSPSWSTAFVNIVGSFVIMFFATLTGPDGRLPVGSSGRHFVMGGLCGGFTTFSAMSLDAFRILLMEDIRLATAYLAGVVGLSLAAAWTGYAAAARINR